MCKQQKLLERSRLLNARKIGRVILVSHFLTEESRVNHEQFFKEFVPLEVVFNDSIKQYDYLGVCEEFDPIPIGGEHPYYTGAFVDGKILFHRQPVKDKKLYEVLET